MSVTSRSLVIAPLELDVASDGRGAFSSSAEQFHLGLEVTDPTVPVHSQLVLQSDEHRHSWYDTLIITLIFISLRRRRRILFPRHTSLHARSVPEFSLGHGGTGE